MTETGEPSFAQVFDDGLFTDSLLTEPGVRSLDPSEVFAGTADTAVGSQLAVSERTSRFDGDTSELAPEVCWALQELVAAPHVSDKSRKHWPIVVQHQDVLRSRLSELGLTLEINLEYRYAFTRQADDPSPHSRSLLRTKTLSLAASTLALYLYHQYVMSPDEPIVETADMIEHMMAYKRAEDTDEGAFQKKIKTAITVLDDAAIIKPIKGTSRYVIYGVITSILTAERVAALEQRYRTIARGEDQLDVEPDTEADTAVDADAEGDDDDV
jgi:hypothetical protein